MSRIAAFASLLALCLAASPAHAQGKKKKAAKKKAVAGAKQPVAKKSVRLTKAQILEKYDKNKDGKLDSKERKELIADRRKEAFERRKRANSRPRLTPFQQLLLREFDKNKDGKLDQAEQKTAQEAIAKKRQEYFRRLQQMLRGGGGRGGRGGGGYGRRPRR